MDEAKGILTRLGEAIDQYHADRRKRAAQKASNTLPVTPHTPHKRLFPLLRWFVPNGGTLLVVLLLIATQSLWAAPLRSPTATSTSTISYQGRLADAGGNPLSDNYNMEFRIYDVPDGGTPLWQEYWTGSNSVEVNDGLFNVMLGSIDTTLASAIAAHDELYLGITVGTDSEMSPRVQLGSVPFSMQALTVADGAITLSKLASEVLPAITSTGAVHYSDSVVINDTDMLIFPGTELDFQLPTRSKILVVATANLHIVDGEGYLYAGICRDGASINQTHRHSASETNVSWENWSWSFVDTLDAGTYTYQLCAKGANGLEIRWYRPNISLVTVPLQQ